MPTSNQARRTHRRKPTNDYFLKLQSPQWQKVRLQVFERAEWMCQSCGDTSKPLEIHHGFYRFGLEPWDLPRDTLWSLCRNCHEEHQQELAELKLEIGKLYPPDYEYVLRMIRTMHDLQGIAPTDRQGIE